MNDAFSCEIIPCKEKKGSKKKFHIHLQRRMADGSIEEFQIADWEFYEIIKKVIEFTGKNIILSLMPGTNKKDPDKQPKKVSRLKAAPKEKDENQKGGEPVSESEREAGAQRTLEQMNAERESERQNWLQAERMLAQEQEIYSRYMKAEAFFEQKEMPAVQLFNKVMEPLVYFAGCREGTECAGMQSVLFNRRNDLRDRMQAKIQGERLSRESIDGMLAEYEEIQQALDAPLPQDFDYPQEEESFPTRQDYQSWRAEAEAQLRNYRIENKKLLIKNRIHEKVFEYIRLLSELFPVIEEITGREQPIDAEWAAAVGREIARIVDEHPCGKAGMVFQLVYPDDAVCAESESIRVDFITGEMDCPGLYYRDNTGGELVCVTPGRIK